MKPHDPVITARVSGVLIMVPSAYIKLRVETTKIQEV